MRPSVGRLVPLGLLGVWALVLGSPRVVEAAGKGVGVIASPPPTVMPAGDPYYTYTVPLMFNPDTTIGEYFAPNANLLAPTDYFTISGFGQFLGFDPSGPLTDFNVSGAVGGTSITFAYKGTSDQSSPLDIGTIIFDATSLPPAPPAGLDNHLLRPPDRRRPDSGTNVYQPTVVPEPSSIALLALGTLGGLYFRRRAARCRA